jgi:hypothetical protein
MTKGNIGPEQRQQVSSELGRKLADIRDRVRLATESWVESVLSDLARLRSSYYDDRERELGHLTSVVGDAAQRRAMLAEVERQLAAVRQLSLG